MQPVVGEQARRMLDSWTENDSAQAISCDWRKFEKRVMAVNIAYELWTIVIPNQYLEYIS